MSRSPVPDPANEPPPPEDEPSRGLVDPRTIHPAPEGLFPDPVDPARGDRQGRSRRGGDPPPAKDGERRWNPAS